MDSDIRNSTKAVYNSRLNTFRLYCEDVGCSTDTAPIEVITNFLAILSSTLNYSYQSVCGYRSAISRSHEGLNNVSVGQAKPVRRVTRATFLARPPLPRQRCLLTLFLAVAAY